jgi:hypothetical protein
MYTELPLKICKEHCLNIYAEYCHVFPTAKNIIPPALLKNLLNLSLDYSFIHYLKDLFFQFNGIQMGNSSSVTIANITACKELEQIWNDENIIFKVRFVDDIFCIVDVTNVKDIAGYAKSIFHHHFLKFDVIYNENHINFLDICIHIENNVISTSSYKKPMNKHQFVHFKSNHPKHMLNNLPYSCGIRIIKNNSDIIQTQEGLKNLMYEFQNRGYPTELLSSQYNKLCNIKRDDLLKPKSRLLINHLLHNNPNILVKYNINVNLCHNVMHEQNITFIAFPFYKIPSFNVKMKRYFHEKLKAYFKNTYNDNLFNIQLGYFLPDSLHKITRMLDNC